MSILFFGLVASLAVTDPPVTKTNPVHRAATLTLAATNAADPVELEFQKIMEEDDKAQEEVDKWIRDNDQFAAKGAGSPREELARRIRERFVRVTKAYDDFLERYPKHARARVAYASLLGDIKDEESAEDQLEKALAVDTNNPAIYNNLANIYGHIGPVKKAFEFYAKAIQLNPLESVYYHNLGTTTYLFRQDAMEFYHIDELAVFAKCLQLYSNAMRLDPQNFPLASDVAQTYYGIQPMRTNDALKAWTNALAIANDEIEREGVYIHLARMKAMVGRYQEAQTHLDAITNSMYTELKRRVQNTLYERQGIPKRIESSASATLPPESKKTVDQ